ncbi:MAG: hypothetical protein MUE91_01910 [Ignavibacteriaceae bacterium]|jgi:hypothetical protein|nr:hypothetical protein [Ignavibacteriaceae bacterium]
MDLGDSVQVLIDRIEQTPFAFEHLKIFLKRDSKSNRFENTEYLMVTPTNLGKVRLDDVNVEDNFIILTIHDCSTQLNGNVRIDINDTRPQTFFIKWQDIREIVLNETFSGIMSDDLLEFDFENAENQA